MLHVINCRTFISWRSRNNQRHVYIDGYWQIKDGIITYEELKAGLRKVGSQLTEPTRDKVVDGRGKLL